jgi:beta-phosphoglucomutase-like phosphatase (HAD superfamily)
MKYKAIIFDMDGTIVDSEWIWQTAGHELIRRRNISLSDQEVIELNRLLRGGALKNSCTVIKEFAKLPEPLEELVKEKIIIAHNLYAQGITFIDGFLDFHKQATQKELKLAIATNGTPECVSITDKVLNLTKLFGKHLYDMSHVSQPKPSPDIYLYAAKQLEIAPGQCIAIEDSAHGIKAAKDAGMFCIGINTSKNPELLQQAHLIINGFHEIPLENLLYPQEKKIMCLC